MGDENELKRKQEEVISPSREVIKVWKGPFFFNFRQYRNIIYLYKLMNNN